MTVVNGLYIGKLRALENDGELTGIYKMPVERVTVKKEGLVGDHQADRRYHGGPEQALHQYAQKSYEKIIQEYPALKKVAKPGSMGENISTPDLDDDSVYIGDIYRIGNVLVQVSRPRSPCWKINSKFETDRLSVFLEQNQITGWYYRVLEEGDITAGDSVELQERFNSNISIGGFISIWKAHRPKLEELEELIACQFLNDVLKRRLVERRDYLSKLDQ